MNEKKRLLPQIEKENWVLFFEHDPFRQACTIARGDKGFQIREEIIL